MPHVTSHNSMLARCLVVSGLVLAACVCPTGILRGGGAPTCPTDGLLAPNPISPAAYSLVADLQPAFSWGYPAPCNPEGYRIEVTDYGAYDDPGTTSGGTGNPSPTWTPASALQPATDYEWRVAAINGTTLGPYSASTRFWTGPLCDAAALAAPVLGQPADGSTVDNPITPLAWSYAEACLPESFAVDLEADPAFPGPSLVADFASPAKAVIPAEALSDCTTYSWRVVAQVGGTTSPASSTWTFTTNFTGACPGGGTGTVSGIVWHDLCAAPGDMQPTPETLPAGCIAGYNANGLRETGEPGLEGVRVDIGVGACPASGLASTLTAADGSYTFAGLTPGAYCVSVDALSEPSTSVLIPGGWTAPTTGPSPVGYSLEVTAGGTLADKDFGWDYQFLPEPDYGPTPTSGPANVTFNKNAFCRQGPSTGFKDVMAFSKGEQALALGRTEDGSWLWVKPLRLEVNCWVSASLADMPFDWRSLASKPTPSFTPASIGGLVWNDKCSFTGGAAGEPVVLGEGCVALGDIQLGAFGANAVRDAGEPGFANVRLRLGSGACPSTGLAEATTNGDGNYRFSGLEPGTYCVTLDPLFDGNPNILIPGGVTYPSRAGGTGQWTVKVSYGEAKYGIDFGWEFQHLG